jgi:hypothetical protein
MNLPGRHDQYDAMDWKIDAIPAWPVDNLAIPVAPLFDGRIFPVVLLIARQCIRSAPGVG